MSAWLSRRWFLILALFLGSYAMLPLLAPVAMSLGWQEAARVIYAIYSTQCHQLPQRSFFLFGERAMYPLADIQAVMAGSGTAALAVPNPFELRAFIGNPAMGWKVAWSDRMTAMYTSLFIFSLIWYALKRRLPELPLWGLVVFLLPLVMDGSTHFISDLAGIGSGFRDNNHWLANLTRHTLPAVFYAGDALGSFNSWARLLTGVLFGMGIAWFSLPYLDKACSKIQP